MELSLRDTRTSPALQTTSPSQGHQLWFPPSPRSAPELLCSVGSPPCADTAVARRPVAWPQGWHVAIAPPKVWWLFLLLALTRLQLKAVLTCALESCVAQPRPGLSGGTGVAAVRAGSPKHRDGSVPRRCPRTPPVLLNTHLVLPWVLSVTEDKLAFPISVYWSELRLEHRRSGHENPCRSHAFPGIF